MNLPPQDRDAPAGTDASEPGAPAAAEPPISTAATDAVTAARRRLAEQIVAGMLPETTSDERSGGPDTGFSERWYEENRPPHHG